MYFEGRNDEPWGQRESRGSRASPGRFSGFCSEAGRSRCLQGHGAWGGGILCVRRGRVRLPCSSWGEWEQEGAELSLGGCGVRQAAREPARTFAELPPSLLAAPPMAPPLTAPSPSDSAPGEPERRPPDVGVSALPHQGRCHQVVLARGLWAASPFGVWLQRDGLVTSLGTPQISGQGSQGFLRPRRACLHPPLWCG